MKKIIFSIIFSLVLAEDRIYYYSDVTMGRVTVDGLENEFIIPPTWPGGHNLTDISLDNSKILYITEGNYQEIVMLNVESMDTLMTDLNTEGCPECENYFPEYALFTHNDNEIIFVDDENLYKYSLLDSSVTMLIEDEDDWGDGMIKKITQSLDKTKLAYLSKNSNITQLRVFDLLNNEISVIDNFININNDCNENNTFWGTGDYLYYTSCISDELSSLFKIHISNGEPAQLLESDIYFIFSTSKQSQLEKLVYTKNSWNSESYRIIDLTSHEIINPENMSGIYEGSQIYLYYQAWSPDHSKVALSGIYASGGWGGVIFEAHPVIFIYDLVMDSIESSIYIANGNAAGGDYFIPSFWVQDNLSGFITIEDIENQSTNEDEPINISIAAYSDLSDELTYFSESDTSAMPVYIDGTSIAIGLEANWNGIGTITVTVTDENQLSDTTDFTVTVLPVNDAPQDFSLVFPTIVDTIQISMDTDETVSFHWEESVDVDSDVTYLTTVTLDYFGNVFTQEYESDTFSVSIAGYEWAVLMTNQNLERWTLQYSVKASDEEYEVVKEGEFVFQNTSLSVDENITPLTFSLYQNYPNPFNPITTLKYDLPEDSFIDIIVYDMLGNVVNNLVNKNQNSGSKSVQWDATNNQGELVSAGVYLYKIQAGEFSQTKKMILLK